MLLIGFQEKWMSSVQEAHDYVKILQSAFDQHLSVGIFRVRGGFNLTKMGIENEAFEMDGRGKNYNSLSKSLVSKVSSTKKLVQSKNS